MLETSRPAAETLSPWGTRNTQQWLLAHHCLWLELCNRTLVPRCFLGYRRCGILGMTLKSFLITKAWVKTIEDRHEVSFPFCLESSLCLPGEHQQKETLASIHNHGSRLLLFVPDVNLRKVPASLLSCDPNWKSENWRWCCQTACQEMFLQIVETNFRKFWEHDMLVISLFFFPFSFLVLIHGPIAPQTWELT